MNFNHLALIICQCIGTATIAICFTQSAVDKIFDWKGNLGWLNGHFSKTIFKSMVPFLLGIVTVLELLAGLMSIVGLLQIAISSNVQWAFWGSATAGLALVSLFLGQRIAKEYAGAAVLVSYIILVILNILLLALGMMG